MPFNTDKKAQNDRFQIRQGQDLGSRGLPTAPAEQNPNVLNPGNQPVLNLLPPKSPPACSLETMIVRCIRKAALQDNLSALAAFAGLPAVRLLSGLVQQFLMLMPLQRSTGFGPSAFLPQRAPGTRPGGQRVFPGPLLGMQPTRLHHLARWTQVRIVLWLVGKIRLGKDPGPLVGVILFGEHVSQVGL